MMVAVVDVEEEEVEAVVNGIEVRIICFDEKFFPS